MITTNVFRIKIGTAVYLIQNILLIVPWKLDLQHLIQFHEYNHQCFWTFLQFLWFRVQNILKFSSTAETYLWGLGKLYWDRALTTGYNMIKVHISYNFNIQINFAPAYRNKECPVFLFVTYFFPKLLWISFAIYMPS